MSGFDQAPRTGVAERERIAAEEWGVSEMSDKPNCYECEHRGTLQGDVHSKCVNPVTNESSPDRLLGIRLHPTGVAGGWALWPYNFDPRWLEACNGFSQKESS